MFSLFPVVLLASGKPCLFHLSGQSNRCKVLLQDSVPLQGAQILCGWCLTLERKRWQFCKQSLKIIKQKKHAKNMRYTKWFRVFISQTVKLGIFVFKHDIKLLKTRSSADLKLPESDANMKRNSVIKWYNNSSWIQLAQNIIICHCPTDQLFASAFASGTSIIFINYLRYGESLFQDKFLFLICHLQCLLPTNKNMESTEVLHHQVQLQCHPQKFPCHSHGCHDQHGFSPPYIKNTLRAYTT